MKSFTKAICIAVMCVVLVGTLSGCKEKKEPPKFWELPEEKIYHDYTIDDEFEPDRIMVLLTQKATFTFKDWSVADFPELNLAEVRDLSAILYKRALMQLAGIPLPAGTFPVNLEKFHTIIVFTLAEPSKENVLLACDLLMLRDDILCAEPVGYHYPHIIKGEIE